MSEYGILQGDQVIEGQLDLYGVIAGNAVVMEHGVLNLYGTVAGNLTVRPNARSEVNGVVAGYLHNFGYARIAGVVTGELLQHADSHTVIVPNSVINGQRR